MENLNAAFELICTEEFSFLVNEYNFSIIESKSNNYGCFITYKNTTTAVKVNMERGEISIECFRLKNGEIPERPIFFKPEEELLFFDLNDLLVIKGEMQIEQNYKLMSHRKYLRIKMNEFATLLRKHGVSVLVGDFSLLSKIKDAVKARTTG